MSTVEAGFPSPAEDYIEGSLDLNRHLVKHPAATFFVRVSGDSMINAGIHPEDILIVDRSLEPVDEKIVIAVIDGELTVKRLRYRGGLVFLDPENDDYQPISITEDRAFEIYSIDEAFLDLTGFAFTSLEDYARDIRRKVKRDTRIPVSVGIGPTKTLAKIANRITKKSYRADGVLDLTPEKFREIALDELSLALILYIFIFGAESQGAIKDLLKSISVED
ncbi:LexA family protein [Desulfocicer niacini]